MNETTLQSLCAAIESLPDPRSKQGVSHPYHGMLALVILGLIAGMPYVAQIRRWAKRHWVNLKDSLHFKTDTPPVDTTLFRALAKTSVGDLQKAFAGFLNTILSERDKSVVAAVDGKVAKQMKGDKGDPLLMLNIFVHNVKISLIDYSVHGDKTNEPGCLKAKLGELLQYYPMLRLLTGDAIFAQRPLMQVLKEYDCDYIFQVKENQPEVLDAVETCFDDAVSDKPDHQTVEKKRCQHRST